MNRLAAALALILSAAQADAGALVTPAVNAEIHAKGKASVLLVLRDALQVDMAVARRQGDDKLSTAVTLLQQHAERTQAPLRAWLDARGIHYRAFWVANFISIDADADTLSALAARDDLAAIELDAKLGLPPVAEEYPGPVRAITAIEPGVSQVNAPAVWAMGFRGQNVLVAGQDTGYQWDHPALKAKYAGWDGSSANHNYRWHDAIGPGGSGGSCGVSAQAPCDDNSHGTHTMGTIVGDDGGSNQIGVAPGARWIGCRNMDQGNGTPTTYSDCFQWLMAPTDLTGQNPNPAMAPHIINNSWGCPSSEGCTTPNILQTVVENVRASGILVVVSAGNSGSGCSTIAEPPAIYAASFTVGAVSGTSMASFSSRGPVTVDGSNRMKPDIVAPGVNVRSSTPGNSYLALNGTSMAGPHVAGVAALLMSADPTLRRDPARIEALMRNTAVLDTVSSQLCGGVPTTTIPNPVFGYGRVDALSAVRNGLGMFGINGFE
ncbi:MAG: S8 family serine peptidase [Lysobacterales bacterium]